MASDQKRLFLALTLSAFVLFTWQAYFAPKPNFDSTIGATQEADKNPSATKVKEAPVVKKDGDTKSMVNDSPAANTAVAATNLSYSYNGNTVQISNELAISGFASNLSNDSLNEVVGDKVPFRIYILQQGKAIGIKLENFRLENGLVLFKIVF